MRAVTSVSAERSTGLPSGHDVEGKTLAGATWLHLKKSFKGNKTQQAAEVGKLLAERAKQANLESVVFDRGGYLFHGRVKALAEAAREGGLKF